MENKPIISTNVKFVNNYYCNIIISSKLCTEESYFPSNCKVILFKFQSKYEVFS